MLFDRLRARRQLVAKSGIYETLLQEDVNFIDFFSAEFA